MTPTELDAIFRAWRDGWFAKNPEETVWYGSGSELVESIAGAYDFKTAREALMYAENTSQAFRHHYTWRVPRPPGIEPDFSFPDPAPLAAGVPIPFPAGKALLAVSVPRPEPALRRKIAEHLAKESPAAEMLKSGIFENKP